MVSFSQRIGLKPMQKTLQLESIDSELRAGIWSGLKLILWDEWSPEPGAFDRYHRKPHAHEIDELVTLIWFHHFKQPIDSIPDDFFPLAPTKSFGRSFFQGSGTMATIFLISSSSTAQVGGSRCWLIS